MRTLLNLPAITGVMMLAISPVIAIAGALCFLLPLPEWGTILIMSSYKNTIAAIFLLTIGVPLHILCR